MREWLTGLVVRFAGKAAAVVAVWLAGLLNIVDYSELEGYVAGALILIAAAILDLLIGLLPFELPGWSDSA